MSQTSEYVVCGSERCINFPVETGMKLLKSTNDSGDPNNKKALKNDKCDDNAYEHCYSDQSSLYNKTEFIGFGETGKSSLFSFGKATHQIDDGGNGVSSGNRHKLVDYCPKGYTWFRYLANYHGLNDYYGICKRTVSNSKDNCCTITGIDVNTCPQDFTPGSNSCKTYILDQCNNESNWGTNKMCNRYCYDSNNRNFCADPLTKHCSISKNITGDCKDLYSQLFTRNKAKTLTAAETKIFNAMIDTDLKTCEATTNKIKVDAVCKGFCSNEDLQSNHRTRCDQMAIKYCNSTEGKKDSTFCSCLNKSDNLAFPFVPVCDGTLCANEGYKTIELINASLKCPPCSQKFVVNGAATVTGNSQSQECNIYNSNLQGALATKANGAPDIGNIDRDENIWKQGKILGNINLYIYNSISILNTGNFLLGSSINTINYEKYSIAGTITNNYTMLIIGYIRPEVTDNYTLVTEMSGEIEIYINGNIVQNSKSSTPVILNSDKVALSATEWVKLKIVYKFLTGDNQRLKIKIKSDTRAATDLTAKYLASGDGNWVKIADAVAAGSAVSATDITKGSESTGGSQTNENTQSESETQTNKTTSYDEGTKTLNGELVDPNSESTATPSDMYAKYVTNYSNLNDDEKKNMYVYIFLGMLILIFIVRYLRTDNGKQKMLNAKSKMRDRYNRMRRR